MAASRSKTLKGVVSQDVADGLASIVIKTGLKAESGMGLSIKRVEIWLDIEPVAAWNPGQTYARLGLFKGRPSLTTEDEITPEKPDCICCFWAGRNDADPTLFGFSFPWVFDAVIGGGTILVADDEMTLFLGSVNTGVFNVAYYKVYYSLVELTGIEAIQLKLSAT